MAESSFDERLYRLHAELCKTLSDATRLKILNHLSRGEKSVGELASLVGASQANLSQHLRLLRQRGIVTNRKQGVNVYYSIANSKIIEACSIIRNVLFEQLAKDGELVKKASGGRDK